MSIKIGIFDEYANYFNEHCNKYGKNSIVLMQVGMFHEFYGVDNQHEKIGYVREIAEILNIQMTRRDKKIAENDRKNFLMAGFPSVALDRYVNILLTHNYTVAIVDQIGGKPITRAITRIYSPGTYVSEREIDNNFLVSVLFQAQSVGLSAIDLSTGESITYEAWSTIEDTNFALDETYRFIQVHAPKEIVFYDADPNIISQLDLTQVYHLRETKPDYFKIPYQNAFFRKAFNNDMGLLTPIEWLDLENMQLACSSLILLLQFAWEHNEKIIEKLQKPQIWYRQQYMLLAHNCIEQLDFKSLIKIIDSTRTPMGHRLFKSRLLNPIINVDLLNKRYADIEKMIPLLNKYETLLTSITDITRIHRRITLGIIQPPEFNTLDTTYDAVIELFKEVKKDFNMDFEVNKFYENILNLNETSKSNLADITTCLFVKGYNTEIDELYLKIQHIQKYFNILGKHLSDACGGVSEKYHDDVLFYTITINRLKTLEKMKFSKITVDNITYDVAYGDFEKIGSELQSQQMREFSQQLKDLYVELRSKTAKLYHEFLDKFKDTNTGEQVAEIDVIYGSAKTAVKYNYCKPHIINNTRGTIHTISLRHPIIERLQTPTLYVPHDIVLGANSIDGMLVYGVNSCGKSSLMKSVGINLIMAQAGLYVSANSFQYSPYKCILTRILGNDNLFKGLSSFAVEMSELRGILKRADAYSLVLGDEICHGTETISAVAIVASAIRYLAQRNTSFIFATHLHQLSNMSEITELTNVANFHLKVLFSQGKLIYDRKLMHGSGDPIYGIEVAKAMKLDDDFIKEANDIRKKLLGIGPELLSTHRSHFNAQVYMDTCAICKKSAQETHHINYQCNANENNYINHFHKNVVANLVPLCHDCHTNVHRDLVKITGYQITSSGVVLTYTQDIIKPIPMIKRKTN